ncbi:MAG: phosphatase PAP2 family protein [Actinomycetales bacterium]|jgi:undecaprenyl-diphosphatase
MTPQPLSTAPRGLFRSTERFFRLPEPPLWWLWGILLAMAVLALGLCTKTLPGLTRGEFGIDQELSRHHEGLLTAVAMTINIVFAPAVGVVIVVLIGAYLLILRRTPVRALAFMAVAAMGWLSAEVVKTIVARPRPNQSLLFNPLAPETGSGSFPSGHVSFAVALTFALVFLLRGTLWAKAAAVCGTIVAVIVAWSRVYIGVHYPTDVLASFLATSAAVIIFAGLWNRYAPAVLYRLRICERPAADVPGPHS